MDDIVAAAVQLTVGPVPDTVAAMEPLMQKVADHARAMAVDYVDCARGQGQQDPEIAQEPFHQDVRLHPASSEPDSALAPGQVSTFAPLFWLAVKMEP